MLLFLDIDGVMIPAKSWKVPEFLDDDFPAFSIGAIAAINKLVSEYSNVTVVLTTSHRTRFTIDQWHNIFEKRGVKFQNILKLNNKETSQSRLLDIMEWFKWEPLYEEVIIIDDDKSLNDLPDYLKKHLILTNPMIGLT